MRSSNLVKNFNYNDTEIFKEDLKVHLIENLNINILHQLVDFEAQIFGDSGMDEWGIAPMVRHGNIFVLKSENNDTLYGIAIFMRDWKEPSKCYLYDYAIKKDYQGQGFGYYFLKNICNILLKKGFENMSLTVDINNKPAIKLYKDKIGFKIIETSMNEYGYNRHRYLMNLDLKNTNLFI